MGTPTLTQTSVWTGEVLAERNRGVGLSVVRAEYQGNRPLAGSLNQRLECWPARFQLLEIPASKLATS